MSSSESKSRNTPDPERERKKFASPVPERELVLQRLEQIGEPVAFDALCRELNISDPEHTEGLRRRLRAMSRDGQIISNRRGVYGLAGHMDLLKGRVQGNKDGFGFFIPDDKSGDLFLNARQMSRLFDGDRVLARLSGVDRRGRKEGMVVEILERRYTRMVGRYYQDSGIGVLVPDSKRIAHEILIPEGHSDGAADGQFVVAEIKEYPSNRRQAIAHVVEVLGDVDTPGVEIDVAVRSHAIPHVWPSPVEQETKRIAGGVTQAQCKGRFDLRQLTFVTIDGEDARDFDDAVFARRHDDGNWTLYVAIADVSHYVTPSSALDEEARNRGTSVYFPGHVVPMLPARLSDDLCSLKPGVDRLAMVCEMEIATDGAMTDYRFYEAVIRSNARLTYTEVADLLQSPTNSQQQRQRDRIRQRHQMLCTHLDNLHALYLALRHNHEARGALDFETTETRLVFGNNRKISAIIPVERNDAHRLIEECMLCANVAAARLLEDSDLPGLYRVHEGPNADKLDDLREFLGELGLGLGGGRKPKPKDYRRLLQTIARRPDRHLLQVLLIRSMLQAVYQPENIGHFGLGFPAYTHFTSPIRRYPDLLVHRAIRHLIANTRGPHLQRHDDAPPLPRNSIYPYARADMDTLGSSCSTAERRADAAGYAVIDWLKCEYMQQHIGDEFSGAISAVTSFGLFVEISEIYIEGLVHISELANDYYHFDPARHRLEGERTRRIYRLGDAVEVRVMRVDMDERKIDLRMIDAGSTQADFDTEENDGKHRRKKRKGSKGKSGKDRERNSRKEKAKTKTGRKKQGRKGDSKGAKKGKGQAARKR